jgi:hypothetical protein
MNRHPRTEHQAIDPEEVHPAADIYELTAPTSHRTQQSKPQCPGTYSGAPACGENAARHWTGQQ